jgi:RHS repeat-associated protein
VHGRPAVADKQLGTYAAGATRNRTSDGFGNVLSGSGAWQGPFGYGGPFGYQEDAAGLRLLGHRFYDPSTGRFLTRDPIKDGRNWYAYCAGDPIGHADPRGLSLVNVALADMLWPELDGAAGACRGPVRFPRLPPGASVDSNIKRTYARLRSAVNDPPLLPQFPGDAPMPDMMAARLVACAQWASDVRFGGPWDYKRLHANPEVYDDAGNFNYGATGRATGLPVWLLLLAGDMDNLVINGRYPDSPDDQYWTVMGARYYDEQYAHRAR